MYALYDEERQSLLRLSAMIVCGALAVLPLTLPPGSMRAEARPSPHYAQIGIPDVPGRLDFPVAAVQKDPFVSAIPFVQNEPDSGTPRDLVHQNDAVEFVLPPNAGAQGAPPPGGAFGFPVVRGVVLGDEPQALIDVGTGVKVCGVGAKLGSDIIRTIDATGVTLSSGIRLRIASVGS